MGAKLIDLTGMKFGKLTVLKRDSNSKTGKVRWVCECECGNKISVQGEHLKNGDVTSCGCIRGESRITHNLSHTRIYGIAAKILKRCNDSDSTHYDRYGGRGIKCLLGETIEEVCIQLMSVDGYRDDLTIDRIDNDGNYELVNLRWADKIVQAHNKTGLISTNTSGVTGVSCTKKTGLWEASMEISHKKIRRKFKTFEEAVQYRQSLEEYYYLKQFIEKGYEVIKTV